MHSLHSIRAVRRPLHRRIQASIWTIPAVVLPILGATLAWFAYVEYEQTVEQEYRFLEAHARIAEGQIAGVVRNIKQLLRKIAAERPALTAARQLNYQTVLAAHNREIPEIRTLAIVDATGHVEMAANPVLIGFDGSQREYFLAHRERVRDADFHITRPYKAVFGDYSIGFTLAMRDAERRLLGVVVAGVNYNYFESVMTQIRPPGAGSVATIFNQDGDILYRLPDPDKFVGSSLAGGRPFAAFKRSGLPMTRAIGVGKLDGVERFFVHRAIADTSLGIGVARPVDDVLTEWRRNLVLRAVLFALAAAVTLRLAMIAHRRQTEVLAGKEFSDQLIETANTIVVGVDAASRIIVVNEAAERAFGYRREELLGRSWFETLMPRARYPEAWQAFQAYYASGDVPRAFEAPIVTKDGRERVIAWQNSAIKKLGAMTATFSFGIDVTEREQLERARYKEEVSRRLVAIHEEERRRLAIELHDRANPNLSVLDINLKLLADSLPQQASMHFANLLEDTSATLTDTIASIRAISTDFRPPLLDYAGLWPALQAYARQFSRRTGIAVTTTDTPLESRLAPDVEANIFRIVQEALTNCAKHAQARSVAIAHQRSGDTITLTIADDGDGFDAETCAQGHGLMTMCQRAKFIGGQLDIDTQPGRGTRITVTFGAAATTAADE